MFIGLLIGILVSLVVLLITWGIYESVYENWAERMVVVVCIVLLLACVGGGALIGAQVKNANMRADIEGYIAVKETYQYALSNSELDSLERFQIIETAIEQNQTLARKQAIIDMWWNFDVREDLKNELKNLTPIK
jgi:hypothetical protein